MVRTRSPLLLAALAASAVLLASCGGSGGADTSTKPEPVHEEPHTAVPAGGELPHWTYQGEEGPDHWGELAEDWATCATGEEQSPIDLSEGVPFVAQDAGDDEDEEADATTTSVGRAAPSTAETSADDGGGAPAEQEIDFRYRPSAYTVQDNGHTVQVELADAGAMVIDGVAFRLVQFHFHAPSEHTLGGASYPMEYHLVHRSDAGELAVVGVMVQYGAQNELLAPIFEHLPVPGHPVVGTAPLDPAELLPANRTMVRYNGSLTTPPCAEDVRWHVMLTPEQLSEEQIERFTAKHPGSHRPVQEPHDREIVVEVDDETGVQPG
jgi:carbonic anhydrase